MLNALNIEVAAGTRIGRSRATNADAYLVDEAAGLLAVSDGMGDAPRSAAVAKVALEAVAGQFEQTWRLLPLGERTIGEARERLLIGIVLANARLFVPGARGAEKRGTTFAGVVMTARHFCVASIGDSRVYLLRSGTRHLDKLTEDDTVLARELRAGTPFEVAVADRDAHALTHAIGVRAAVEMRPVIYRSAPGDTLLLCTDGVSDRLRTDQIAGVLLEEDDLGRAVDLIIERAQTARGRDDATVIIARRSPRARCVGDGDGAVSESGVRRVADTSPFKEIECGSFDEGEGS